MNRFALGVAVAALFGLMAAGSASATTIYLSAVSSDATDPALLDASFDFAVVGSSLTLTVTNTGSDFDINEVFFNASASVTGLTLTSATHNVAGDVSAAWLPIDLGANADGFGSFDFGLTDGVGSMNPNIINPGESIAFSFTIAGFGGYVDADFIVPNLQGYTGAAKFVNGPDDPEAPGFEDSAYGAVPEPGTALLLGLGLAGLAARRRAPK